MGEGKLQRLAARYRRDGAIASARAIAHAIRVKADMAALEILRRRFGFEVWHARSPDSARAYRKELAKLVNSLSPASVVEVGCGLGGILPRVNAATRSGYDVDAAVIRAARFLHWSIHFIEGGFDRVTENPIDVLIAVNWIHGCSPEQLREWLAPLLPRVRYLLVDAIDPGTPGYLYYHDFEFLGAPVRLASLRVFEERNRSFFLWQLQGHGAS